MWDFFLWQDHNRGALQWDWNVLFLWMDRDSGALWNWDLLFLWRDHNSDGLRQWYLRFPNAHVLHVGDLLFPNVCDAK
jgi:hypothetical protein